MTNAHHIRPQTGPVLIDVRPETAGWRYLSFRVVSLAAGEGYAGDTAQTEMALVPLRGQAEVTAGGQTFALARQDVFVEKPQVLYAPPGTEWGVTAVTDFEFAYGAAPAGGKYPLRLFQPAEMKVEVRGEGAARRQVNHILAYPLPAERLILFEVYVPGGRWSGWPPHCHDGYAGSPYLEEVYYYRITPESGFAIHRNYRRDTDFDENFAVRDGDLVLVTQGFHPVAAAPGSRVYFLNYLAGDLLDEARGTPPYDDPDWGFMKEDWGFNGWELPLH